MKQNSLIIALFAALAGAATFYFIAGPMQQVDTAKTDRLSGVETETAFLPERFGVPSSQQ